MAKPRKVKNISPLDPVSISAVKILETRLREFYSHWPDPSQKPTNQQLHNLRISGKRLRYSAECLSDLFPDRLAFLIDLMKRCQDLLGEIQDAVSQREMIERDLKRLKRRPAKNHQIAILEKILEENNHRYDKLYSDFRDFWAGLALKRFRRSLRAMVSNPLIAEEEKNETNENNETNERK